jgi:UDP-N-acetylmuramoylalanine--D-glutamate ligase
MMDVRSKHIAIIGAARSGLAAARLLNGRGADVFVSDSNKIQPDVKLNLDFEEIPYEEDTHSTRAKNVDLAIVSPGVPDHAPLMKYYANNNIPVYSEIEAASWFNKSPIIAVTGSNGKTTVTSWLARTWEIAGKPFLLAGNIGVAFCDVVTETRPGTTAILELSSFQLDHIQSFRPDVSIILNITPDHLDRYDNSFEKYTDSKIRITENQQVDDTFIYNYDDPVISRKAKQLSNRDIHPRMLVFSLAEEVERGAFIRDDHIVLNINDSEEILMHTSEVGLPGRHNLNNGLATALAARVSEIKSDHIRESLRRFEGVEHRLELVRILDGVKYINDSKATNINAVWFALDSFKMPVVLILGGRDKGNDYTKLKDQIHEKVHSIIAIGEAREPIRQQLADSVPNFLEADNLEEAVMMSRKKAKRGEIVLLSPACSSFDMFENYEHRGRLFKEAVMNL